jgi:hypothetical protein
MNIFKALSQGYGRLNEENMSAMLGFLLAPYEAHGMSDIFLRLFLEAVAEKCSEDTRFKDVFVKGARVNAQIVFEQEYVVASPTSSKIRRPDIEIRLYDPLQTIAPRELHRVVIENKIHPRAAQPEQFHEEYAAIKQQIAEENEQGTVVTMVFLTPLVEDAKLKLEYEQLKLAGKDAKVWLYWHGEAKMCVTAIIRDILHREDQAEIAPVSDYMRHTLKAFIRHIIETMQLLEKGAEFDVGGLKEDVTVSISTGQYRLELYESSSVRTFNLSTSAYEDSTLALLKCINQELGLGISLNTSGGTPKNTRILGRQIIDQLKQMGHQ